MLLSEKENKLFNLELVSKNERTFIGSFVIFNTLYVLWAPLDFILLPEHAYYFLSLRLIAALINLIIFSSWFFFQLKRFTLEFFWCMIFIWGIFTTLALPYTKEYFSYYLLGFSLIIMAPGIVPQWHYMYAFSCSLAQLVSFLLVMLFFDVNPYSKDKILIFIFISITSLILSVATSYFKFNLLKKEYVSRKKLEIEQQISFELREKGKLKDSMNKSLNRFVPNEFLKILGKENIMDVALGDQIEKEMTLLFVDIRSYTKISENMTPKENIEFLNSYLQSVGPIIRKHHGFIDKYIGDEIMAIFPTNPQNALEAAIEINRKMKAWNTVLNQNKLPVIKLAMGIHTGNLMLGMIGDEQRMDGTVISDAVNVASRLVEICKEMNAEIITSQYTLSKCHNSVRYITKDLGFSAIRGRTDKLSLMQLIDFRNEI